ncbi:UNVERIFIED_CONTAM: hypothetical protein HDU68_003004, partial [Siphonaria sp. JEL0065]
TLVKPVDKSIVRGLVRYGCPNFEKLCDLYEQNMATGRLAAGSVGSRISTTTEEPDAFDDEDESFGYLDENLGSSSLSHSLHGLSHITALGSSVSAGSNASGFTTPSPQLSVEPSGKRQKLSATNGERPPRSHTSGSSSC